jgi:hypothetical protein
MARSRTKERDRTKTRAVRLIAPLVLIGLSIAGCGGGGKTNEGSQAKAAYIARADRICETEQAKRERLERRVGDLAPITPDETHVVAQLLRKAGDELTIEVGRLRALSAPVDPGTPASLLSILNDQTVHLQGWANAYDHRNAAGIRGFQVRIAEDSAKAAAIARHYGFQVCGDPGNGNPGNPTRFR